MCPWSKASTIAMERTILVNRTPPTQGTTIYRCLVGNTSPRARLIEGLHNLAMLEVYAPTLGAVDAAKHAFYMDSLTRPSLALQDATKQRTA